MYSFFKTRWSDDSYGNYSTRSSSTGSSFSTSASCALTTFFSFSGYGSWPQGHFFTPSKIAVSDYIWLTTFTSILSYNFFFFWCRSPFDQDQFSQASCASVSYFKTQVSPNPRDGSCSSNTALPIGVRNERCYTTRILLFDCCPANDGG